MSLLMTIAGLAMLLVAGDVLVKGAIALSVRAGLSAALISLTVVAFGTSAPELVIAIEAALEEAPDIALGNVVGSNIANILLVLGVAAMLAPIGNHDRETRRSYLFMIGASFLFYALCIPGQLGVVAGLIMLGALAIMLITAYRRAQEGMVALDDSEIAEVDAAMPVWKIAAMILGGIIFLPLGANLLIEGARDIALSFGISERAIGLTLVAVGTSLPELAATGAAAWRGRADVAMGNAIGSNMFNLLAIMGIASLVHPIDVQSSFLTFDIPIMIVTALVLAPFIFRGREICRWAGAAFVVTYLVYSGFVLAS